MLDTGVGSSYASAALSDRISNRWCKKEVRKIEMILGATTREVELSTIEIKEISGDLSMAVEVTKLNKSELLYIDNPRYQQLMTGVKMEDLDTKDRLPVHIILGASAYVKLKTDSAPRIGQVGQPVAELTKFGWTILSPAKESVDLLNMLLTQTSQADYEQLCPLVLRLEDTPADDQGSVYDEFKEQLTRDQAGRYEMRIKHLLPFFVRNLYVMTLIVPLFDYVSIVWGDKDNKTLMNLLQVHILYNKAAKVILNRSPWSSSTDALKELKWLDLSQRRELHHCMHMYSRVPEDISSFTKGTDFHEYNMRNKHMLRTVKSTTNWDLLRSQNSCLCSCNSLSNDIQSLSTIKKFKRAMKSFITENN